MSEESSLAGPSRLRVSRSQIAPSEFPSELLGSSQQLGETSAPFDAVDDDSRWTAEGQQPPVNSHAGRLRAILLQANSSSRNDTTPRPPPVQSNIPRSDNESDYDIPDHNTPIAKPSVGIRTLEDIFRRSEVQESPRPVRKPGTSEASSEQSHARADSTTGDERQPLPHRQPFSRPLSTLRAKLDSTNLDESVDSSSAVTPESTPRLNGRAALHPTTLPDISVQDDTHQDVHEEDLNSPEPPSPEQAPPGHGRTSLLATRSRAISLFEKNYGEISFPSAAVESSTPMKPPTERRRTSSSAGVIRRVSSPIYQHTGSPASPTSSVSSHRSNTSASMDPALVLKDYERERNWNAPRPHSYHSTHPLPIRRLSSSGDLSDLGISPRRTRERADSNASSTSSLASGHIGARGGTPSPGGNTVARTVSFSRKGKERARESFPSIDEQLGRLGSSPRPSSPLPPHLGRATTSPHATSTTGSPRSPRAMSAMGSVSRNRTLSTPTATTGEVIREREKSWNSPRPMSLHGALPASTTPPASPHVHTRTKSLFGAGGLLRGGNKDEKDDKGAEDLSVRHGGLKRATTTGQAGRPRVSSEHVPAGGGRFGFGLKASPSITTKQEVSRAASPSPSVDNTSRSSLTRSSSSSNKIKTFVGTVTDAFKKSPKKEKEKKGIAAGLFAASNLGRDILGHGEGTSPVGTPPSSPERTKKKSTTSAVGAALKDTLFRRNRTNSSLQSGTSSGDTKETESEVESAEIAGNGGVRDSGVDFGGEKEHAEEVKQKMREMTEEEERRRRIEEREQEEFEERRMMRMREKEREEDWEKKKKEREEERLQLEREEQRHRQQKRSSSPPSSSIPLPQTSTPLRSSTDESRLLRAIGTTTPAGTPPNPRVSISISSGTSKAEGGVVSLDSPPITPLDREPSAMQSLQEPIVFSQKEDKGTRIEIEDLSKRSSNEIDLGDDSDFEAITIEEISEATGTSRSPKMSAQDNIMETPPRPKYHRPRAPPTPPSPAVELPPLPSDDEDLSEDNIPQSSAHMNGNGNANGASHDRPVTAVPPKTPKFPGAFDLSAYPATETKKNPKTLQQLAPLDLAGDDSPPPSRDMAEASYMSDSDVGRMSAGSFRSKARSRPSNVRVPGADRMRTMSAPAPSPFVIQNLDAVVKQRYPQTFQGQQQPATPLRRANSALDQTTVAKTPAPPGGWSGTPVAPGGSVRKGILKVRFDSYNGPEGIPGLEEVGTVVQGAHTLLKNLAGDTNGEGAFANAFDQPSKGKRSTPRANLVDAFGRELMFAASDGAPIKRLDEKLLRQDGEPESASGSRSTSPGPGREGAPTIRSDSLGFVPLGPNRPDSSSNITPRRRAKMRMLNQFGEEVGDTITEDDNGPGPSSNGRTSPSEKQGTVTPDTESVKDERLRLLKGELNAAFDYVNSDSSIDRSIERPSTPLTEKLERDSREAELRRNSDKARLERAKLQREEQLAANGLVKLKKPSSRDVSKRNHWLNWVTFGLAQLALIIIYAKIAGVVSEYLFLTTYYDPAYAALNRPGKYDTPHAIISQWVYPGRNVSIVYIIKNWFLELVYDWFSWNIGGSHSMQRFVVPS